MNTSIVQSDGNIVTPPRYSLQFSLRMLLLLVLALSVLFAVTVRFPRQVFFVVSMSLLLASPLTLAGVLTAVSKRIGVVKTSWPSKQNSSRLGRFVYLFQSPARFLGLCQPETSLPLATSLIIALVSTATIVGMWAAIREVGLTAAEVLVWPLDKVWSVMQRLPEELANPGYWLRLGQWELWSVGRWWLLFGVITSVWLLVSIPLRQRLSRESASETWCRLLTFAPWIMVLELTFLIGVWIVMPDVVPEPSTGFVVGIFAWNLWHWDCWLDRLWLIRGTVPTIIVGVVFFRSVLRWHWLPALAGALCLVPVAITLSIAATVLYIDLFL